MNKIIVTDIFGLTPALLRLAKAIKAETIVDPYGGNVMSFTNETQAYEYFTTHIGLDAYVAVLSNLVKTCTDEKVLVGFSVGAAAIWKLSALISAKKAKTITHAICYYGSQIRHMNQVSPKFQVRVVLPASEPHFDVVALSQTLALQSKVSITHVDYLHGFMNELSTHFNLSGYEEHLALLQSC